MGMPARSEPRKQWTLEEVRALRNRTTGGTRYELVDGELLVTPAPTGAHQLAVQLLCGALYSYVRAEKIGLAALAPRDVDLEPDKSVQPDVFVVPPDEVDRFRGGDPVERLVLAAEVLSPSSARTPFTLDLTAYFAEVFGEDG
jgi:Uma2 family endonuclease